MSFIKSILSYLNAAQRPAEIPPYKKLCCMKYIVEKQCKRCPFRQIDPEAAMQKALNECRDKRRGTYKHEGLEIEYNNQYG
ncbi:MAG: hypothetical protein Q8P95_03170 [bacterium]|nr:hypothetical protein [bacterium]